MKKIAIVAGRRPEVIKMVPIYFALSKSTVFEPTLVSNGQYRQMLGESLGVLVSS